MQALTIDTLGRACGLRFVTMRRWCTAGALLVLAASAVAQDAVSRAAGSSGSPGSIALYVENDVFISRRDRDYSSGGRLAWLSRGHRETELRPLALLMPRVGLPRREDLTLRYGASLTQLIFHPEYQRSTAQPAGERRYAGWLAAGLSMHAGARDVLNSLELSLGTTGPRAFAEEFQDAVHDAGGFVRFGGWDEQVPNEVTVDATFTQRRRFELARNVDAQVDWSLRLGSFRTEAAVGGLLRVGHNLRAEFLEPRISATAYAFPAATEPHNQQLSCYWFVGAAARGVAHDATLDGPLFNNFETGNEREPFFAEGFTGIALRYRNAAVSYAQTLRSRDYAEQDGFASFGSFEIRVEF